MANRPALKVVDPQTGELTETCPNCKALEDQLASAETDVRSWRSRYQHLKRDKAAEAKDSTLWPDAVELFRYWQGKCNHPRSKFTTDRYYLVEPFLREHGLEMCKRAVDGAAFDPWMVKRRNGTMRRFDSFELIFRNEGKLEEFANKAPLPSG